MTRPFRLIPVDRFEGDIVCEDDTYLYRVKNNQNFERIPKSDLSSSTQLCLASAFPGSASVGGAIKLLSSGTFVTQGVDAAGTIVRSTDGGSTWLTVTTLDGEVLGSRGINVIELSNGNQAVILGTYEVLTAGENVEIKLLTNDAATSTTLNSWAVNNANIRHIHAVVQDPFTKQVWVCCGDTNAQSGFLVVDQDKIDDLSAWSNIGDVALSSISGVDGFVAIEDGTQKFRGTDIVFTEKYAYFMADASATGIYRGIIRIDKQTYEGVYIDKTENAGEDRTGYWSLTISNNQVIHMPLIQDATPITHDVPIYSHIDNDKVYKIAQGQQQDIQSQFNPRVLWMGQEGKIYFAGTPMAGTNDQRYTVVWQVTSDRFYGPEPDNLWPVYFVSPTGAASASVTTGIDPRNKAGITAVLNRGNGCGIYSTGAVFLFEEGDYSTSTNLSVGDYSNGTFTYEAVQSARIQIRGTANTNITGTGASYLMALAGAVDFNLLISDFNTIKVDSTQTWVVLGNAVRNTDVIFQDIVQLGQDVNDQTRFYEIRNENVTTYRCKVLMNVDTSNNEAFRLNQAAAPNQCKLTMHETIIEGSRIGIYMGNDGEFEMYNSVIKGYEDTGHFLDASANNVPLFANSVFYSDVAGSAAFDDNASADYTGRITNCIFDAESTSSRGVDDTEYGQETVIDPLVATAGHIFVDPSNDDYTPIIGSTAYKRGAALQNLNLPSKNKQERLTPPSIGPDEYIVSITERLVGPAVDKNSAVIRQSGV